MEALGAIGIIIVFALIWWVLEIIGNWKLFQKAGKPGWHSIIPILIIFDRLARIVLGFGSARYVGKAAR